MKSNANLVCPYCGSNNTGEIIYGLISGFYKLKKGEVLGGCIVSDDFPNRHCLECGHEWIER